MIARHAHMLSLLAAILAPCAPGADWDDLPAVKPGPNDWPWWRGPTQNGKAAPSQKPPVKWSENENVVWKTRIPGRGHGSPTVWGNRIFLVTADDKTKEQFALCYAVDTGKQLWKRKIHSGNFVKQHPKNSQASGSPACDGERVFVCFANDNAVWMTALDLDGSKVWQERLGDFKSVHGYVGSPAVYKSLVIMNGETLADRFVTARHRKTGKEIWRARREKVLHSFSSPSIGRCCGRDQLVLVGPKMVESYDPMTGQRLWGCDGPSDVGATTATIGENMVYATGGYPKRALLAIRGDGSGNVTDSHLAWRIDRDTGYVTSILLHDGLLYMVFDNRALLRVIEAESGKEVYQQKMSAKAECSSSPMLANGNIYLADEKGVLTVFKPGRTFEKVAVNDLRDGGFASPVFVNNRIYLRTSHNLYCIGEPN